MSITPESTLLYLKRRLRAYIDPAGIPDDSLLLLVGEGYQQLCQQADGLRLVTTIPDVTGQAEYDLPADHYRTLRVYRGGYRLPRVTDQDALVGVQVGYYGYASILGVTPTPTSSDGETLLYYSRTPTLPTSWNATLDADFPPELCYGIYHYAQWRAAVTIGGEQRIPFGSWHHTQYEQAILQYRRLAGSFNQAGPYLAHDARVTTSRLTRI